MTPKIFITGATGYIGGDALYSVYKAHPEYEYTCLVRNPDRGAVVAAAYPKLRLVYGDLDSTALIEEESSKADIVIHTADSSDHFASAQAISKGLKSGHSKQNPGFWIHVSGTGILTWKDMETKTFGEGPSQPPYDDLENVSALCSLPDAAPHRDVDKVVLASASDIVQTAIVAPPTIYGPGRGPGNKRSIQVYNLAKFALKKGHAVQLGKGLTEWDNVHIEDLGNLFVLLVEAAVASKEKGEISDELWGAKGYFLAENGYHLWGDVSRQIAEVAFKKGYIKTKEVESIDIQEAIASGFGAAPSWGLNSKGSAKRARKFLGWKPMGRSLEDEIPDIVDGEAKSLGLVTGHAAKVAGGN